MHNEMVSMTFEEHLSAYIPIAEIGDTTRPASRIASETMYINFCPIIIASVILKRCDH